MLESKLVRHLDLRDLPCLETLRPLVAPSLRSGCHSPGPSGFLNTVDPSVSVPNYYLVGSVVVSNQWTGLLDVL